MKKLGVVCLSILTLWLAPTSFAEIKSSSPGHYHLHQLAQSSLAPEELWQRLIKPSTWWHPDHTYSGDAKNLTLDLRPGGLWQESWGNNSVVHGSVLLVMEGKQLRLNAPFGPLQEMAVNTVWTISIAPNGEGSQVTFDERANGSPASKLDELAKAVDYVKTEAIKRLVNPKN